MFLILVSSLVIVQDASSQIANNPGARAELKNLHNDKYVEKYNYQNDNQTIICESKRGRRAHCHANTRYGVNFLRQFSRSSCEYNWGYDETGIWVDHGCAAEFSVNYGWDQAGSEGNIMSCGSYNFQRKYCPAYLGGRDVFLLRQMSKSSCINNWGYDRNGVWVTNGCRAEFVVEDRHNTSNDVVICSSRNLRFQSCPANTRGGVDFIRQLSRTSCNGNWGYDQRGIWVTNGCRAKFKLIKYNNHGNNHNKDTIRCSSRNNHRKVCTADTSGGVRLIKQRSKASCRGNWGYTRNHIWVDNGCRATFKLYEDGYNSSHNNHNNGYGNNNSGRGQNNGYGNNNNYGNNNPTYGNQQVNRVQNKRIKCESHNLNRRTCKIPYGAKIKLYKQLSNVSCGKNWGYNKQEIWVSKGCRAEFSIF